MITPTPLHGLPQKTPFFKELKLFKKAPLHRVEKLKNCPGFLLPFFQGFGASLEGTLSDRLMEFFFLFVYGRGRGGGIICVGY